MVRFRLLGVLSLLAPACSLGLSTEEFTGGKPTSDADDAASKAPDADDDGRDAGLDDAAVWPDAAPTIARGILARWRFDESEGLAAQNSAGANGVGTLRAGTQGFPTRSPGMLGSALTFAGGAHVEASYDPSLSIGAELTVTLWAKAGAGVGSQPRLLAYLDRFDVKLNGRAIQLSLAGVYAIANYKLPNDQWHHFGVVLQAGRATWYVDGLRIDNSTDTFTGTQRPGTETGPILIATNTDGSNYTGTLDDVRVYGVPLTSAEVASVAAER